MRKSYPISVAYCIALCFLCHSFVFAQPNQQQQNFHEQCGTQAWLETQFRAYPELRGHYEKMEKRLGDGVSEKLSAIKMSNNTGASNRFTTAIPIVTIPVVVHLVDPFPSAITNSQIYALIDTLNKDFGGNNGDSIKIPAAFKSLFGKSNIRFALAQRTPAGISTNGIIRYISSTVSSSSSTSDPIKSTAAGGADAWNTQDYFNIWIGTFNSAGLLGYAAFPITSPENPSGLLSQQGVVIEKSTIPGGTLANYNNGRVLTHEAGHFFWLRHIWGDATCGNDFPNTPGIDDTPPASGPSSGCSVGIYPTGCSGSFPDGRMYQNYMDYSNSLCMAMFSTGQTIRMQVALDSFRTLLKTSAGCEPVVCPQFNINVIASTATSVNVSVSGGQAPYTYSLDSVYYQASNNFSGLTPGGTYTVYVRDSIFCKGLQVFTVSGVTISSISSRTICAGDAFAIDYTTTNPFAAGNVFIAQLSDSTGSFNNPLNIGTLTSNSSNTIQTLVPAGIPAGTRYRVRIIATNPYMISNDNGTDIEINNSLTAPQVYASIIEGSNPSCIGNFISFGAKVINGGSDPVITWKKNDVDVFTGPVYTTDSLQTGDIINCSLLSNSSCAPIYSATSNSITVSVHAAITPSIHILADKPNEICAFTRVTFTSVIENAGPAPVYQWKKNGVFIGTGTQTYVTDSLKNGDIITCALTSSLACANPASVLSNSLSFSVLPSNFPSSVITSSLGIAPCLGSVVTFTANPSNAGSAPSYQWKKNGINVGTNSNVFTTANLSTGDTIRCFITGDPSNACQVIHSSPSNMLIMNMQNCGAQLVSGHAFLKDNFIEVAVGSSGTFSAPVLAPAGYHPRGAGAQTSTLHLGFVADPLKTGWVNYVGDYFLPGVPEEGFGITINGISYNNNLVGNLAQIPGSILNIQSGASEKSATWRGAVGGLTVSAKTYIPAGALYFVTTVTVTNASASPLNNIYYMRNVDPDQGISTPYNTGSSNTYNSVVFQNPNTCNRVLVSATPRGTAADYLGLGSTDPRARVTFGGFANRSAESIWYGGGLSTSGTNVFGDFAMSIAFKLGTLAANESTTFSYAHILDAQSLDQAMAATSMIVKINDLQAEVGKEAEICENVPVTLTVSNYGSYTSWSWSPSTGLDTAGGTQVYATVTQPITYTATGMGPCGAVSLTIPLKPTFGGVLGSAGPISGTGTPAQGAASVTYAVAPLAGATKYIWKIPNGVVFNSKQDSNVISVRMPVNVFCDSISVTPVNVCNTGINSSLAVCTYSPYAVTPGQVAGICPVTTYAYLPYTNLIGNPGYYSITWDSAATAAGLLNVVNALLPGGQIVLSKPALLAPGNYSGKISVGNGIISSSLYDFVLPVLNIPVVIPSISISANTSNNICAGTPVTFTANITNGGPTPVYQWRRNGILVGTNAPTFSISTLANGDNVNCTVYSSAPCVSPGYITSASISFTVTSVPITSLAIASLNGTNACSGSVVSFTASPSNPGTGPTYQWKKNNVNVATGLTYSASDILQGDSILCELTCTNLCGATVTILSNLITMNVFTVTAPTVSTNVGINCGDSVSLSASPTTPGNIIAWYTSPTDGVELNRLQSFKVSPSVTTTYYAGAVSAAGAIGKSVLGISTSGAAIIDHNGITGDDRAGIVLGKNYVYYTGDGSTGRFTRNLTNGTSLPLRDGFFSDLSDNTLWQLGTNTSNGASQASGTITRLYKLTEDLVPTGNYITLSQFITISGPSFLAAGEGFVIISTSTNFYRIDLTTGDTKILGSNAGFTCTASEGWAAYGWAEWDGLNYSICFTYAMQILRRNVTTGANTVIQSFANLSDMAAIVFDGTNNRMYFHHEGYSQFGGTNETLGYVPVTTTAGAPICQSARIPVTITVNTPAITPSLSIATNYTGVACAGATLAFTAIPTNGGAGPTYLWKRNAVTVATGSGYSSNLLSNGDVISCEMTTSLECVTTKTATNSLTVSMSATTPTLSITSTESGNVCFGNNVLFTATISNITSPIYQWKKNGVNVGTNSSTYLDNSTASGSILCQVTATSPCNIALTSNTISITSTTPVTPSITIKSNSGRVVCQGAPVTFTATANNGGSSPLYQWKKNGIIVRTGPTYTETNFTGGDSVTCVLTSSIPCVTQAVVVSNTVYVYIKTPPELLTVADRYVCPGQEAEPVFFAGAFTSVRWTNSNPAVGLPASGIGNIPAFTPQNSGDTTATATIVVTAYGPPQGFLYIPNSANNTVSVQDLSGGIIKVIPVGSLPWAVTLSPDGSKVFVSNTGTPASISVISTATLEVIATIPVTGPCYGMAITRDGGRLLVADRTNSTITSYNTTTYAYIGLYHPRPGTTSIVVSPDNSKFYVSNDEGVDVYSLSAYFLTGINIGKIRGLAISPDGSRLYASNIDNNTVITINTATNTVIGTVNVGTTPNCLALSPDGKLLYSANTGSDNISVINTEVNVVFNTISAYFGKPNGLQVSADGSVLYSINTQNGSLSVYNTSNNMSFAIYNSFPGAYAWGNFAATSDGCPSTPITFKINVSQAGANTWTGTTNNNWFTATNWSCNKIPTSTDNVIIALSATGNYPVITTGNNIVVKSVKVVAGAIITTQSGASLTLTGKN